MHLMHGNGGTLSWKESHMNQNNVDIRIGSINAGGLSSAAKRKQPIDLDFDILAICETHLQAHLHSSISEQFSHSNCTFSPDPESRHFQGDEEIQVLAINTYHMHGQRVTHVSNFGKHAACVLHRHGLDMAELLSLYIVLIFPVARVGRSRRDIIFIACSKPSPWIRCLEVRSLLCSLETLICRPMKIPFSQLRCIRKAGITLPT